jgi:tetratricopeptide (TPR) repeat protein
VLASHLDGDPAAAEVHLRAAAPDAFDDDSELPASLARQGFERVTDDALDDDPVTPSDALRSGFTPAEVRHGYAIERVVDEAGEALSTHLVDRLADGEDCALVGPPGSGKSTSCMSAAVAWTERDLGPVLYRSGAADGTVDDPELLAAYARVLDGHVLVVAEDAPRAEASAAFEALTACGDDEDVSFLFDAREHEWRDAPSGRGALAAVSMPSLGPAAVERLVERVESLTGVDVDADAEELLEAVGDGAADGGPTPGAMYRLKHWLSLHADDAGATATPDSALTADVARVHEAVATVPLGTDVAVLANLLNLAGVAVRRELVYALVFAMVDGDYAPPETEREGDDAAAVGAVDDPAAAAEDALAALAGDCVFEWSREREPARFRCRHETWSTAFLVALLEEAGPEAARERVGRVVSALLSLADDDRLRERVVDALGGRGLHLRRASADPAGWADDVVEQLFAVPTDRGHLAPLYGHSDDSPVDLPDACSPAVELRVAARRGEAYDQQGDVTAARREHEWLLEHAGDLAADGATADEFRAEAGHRLATHARDEGDLERAERLLAESRERFRDLDDPAGLGTVERNLGIVGAMNGDRDAAEEHFEAALEHHREAGNRTGLANAYNDRGRLAKMRGELDVAADCLSAARDLSADVGDARREAVSTMNLGTVAMERNDFERARSLLVRALGLAREAGYESGVVSVLTNLGSAALRMDDLDDAEDHLQGALAKSRDLDDGRNEMRALRNLGEVARRRGHLEAAGSYLDEAAAVVEDPESRPGLVLFRARLARDRGDLEAAADRFRTITDDYPVRAGRDLADVARMQGDLDAAEARIERCLEHCRDTDHPPNHGATLAVRARVALDRGDLDGAATAVDRAADRCDPDDPDRVADFAVGTVRGRLHLRRGDYQAAVDQLRPVASAARDADVLRATLRAVDPLVQALVELDRPDAAASWCATAAEMAADAGRPDRQRAFRERRAEVAGTT